MDLDLRIEAIEVSAPHRVATPIGDGWRDVHDLAVRVRNASPSLACHAATLVHYLGYEAPARTLRLEFMERALTSEEERTLVFVGRRFPTVLVQPGATETIRARFPRVIKRVHLGDPARRHNLVEAIDVGDLERIVVRIAYNESPFYERPETMKQRSDRLQAWARVAEATLPIRLESIVSSQ